jgi:type IV secretory pathway VirB10-like protein
MADNTNVEARHSPDFLVPPGRGQGVRRLNRLPLLIVGGLGLLAILAITYTLFEREAAMNGVARAPVEAPSVGAAATPPVQPSDALGPPTPPAPPVVPAAAPTAPADAYKARMQLIERLESKRVSAEMAALTASATVQGFEKPQAAMSSTPGGAGEMTPAQRAGLQAAQAMLGQGGTAGATTPIVPALNVATGLGGDGAGLTGLVGGAAGGDPNRQAEKRAFLAARDTDTSTYLSHTRTPPLSGTEIKAGTVIPGVLISGVNSDLPGQIIAQLRRNVYDTATGRYLLIPAGARLIGTYDSSVAMGQSRVLVGWRRIIYPDGSSVSLDLMPGTDQSGYAGFHDQVNNHLWQIFGNALLLSAFSAGVQLSQPQATNGQNYNSAQIVAGALGMQLGELGMQLAQRGMNMQPTLQIRPGYEFNIMVTKDIILPVWQG